jgi:hypothetical protein
MVFQGKMPIHNEITEVEVYFPDLPWSQIILKQSIANFRVGDLPGVKIQPILQTVSNYAKVRNPNLTGNWLGTEVCCEAAAHSSFAHGHAKLKC